jgi:phosphohistidine phosphatase
MLQLMLLRHAKSSWDDKKLDDRERPLSRRGRAAAQAMGRVMQDRGLLPDSVLTSPARRTRETWELATTELKKQPKQAIEDALYDFGNGNRIAEVIRQKGGKARSLLIIGHNPALENIARRMIGAGDAKLAQRLEKKYPTGGLAVFEVNAETWATFDETQVRLTQYIRPKDILSEQD